MNCCAGLCMYACAKRLLNKRLGSQPFDVPFGVVAVAMIPNKKYAHLKRMCANAYYSPQWLLNNANQFRLSTPTELADILTKHKGEPFPLKWFGCGARKKEEGIQLEYFESAMEEHSLWVRMKLHFCIYHVANVLTIGSFYVDAGSNFYETIHFDAGVGNSFAAQI